MGSTVADFAQYFPGKEGSGCTVCLIPARSLPVTLSISIDGINLLQISPKIFQEKRKVVNWPLYFFYPCPITPCPPISQRSRDQAFADIAQ
jgi:hypothetical protein